ncbi:hypothetical protein [Bacillus thuringiensis]|uniref:hypothetical protein n=1 Tax=Bacillus thuringiensis TaxID=1428 RepID=UPI0021D68F97|nr:hypothetical protein [Bacillus thuringiensis]MCU7667235.1 hypothetical protein [Bacillus thuringiensis]
MSKGLNNFQKLQVLKKGETSASGLIEEKPRPKKMTFDIDRELHDVLKQYNKNTGVTLGFMLNEAVKDYCQKKGLME